MDLLDTMATFVRVSESGSFSAAARQLRISAAAVSRQIAALEAEVRVELLTRTTRRMALTSAGRRYYERCLRVLREVDEAQHVVRGDAMDGPLQMSAPVSYGLARVVPDMRSLMVKHPALRLDLRLDDRLVDLVAEGVDVAIRVGGTPPESNELIAHRLGSFRRLVVASPAYLKRKGEPKTPEALAKHDAVSRAAGPGGDIWTLMRGDQEARVRVNVAFHCNALHALRDLAIDDAGVAMLPEWFVVEEVRRRQLRVVLPEWRSEVIAVHALHRTELRGSVRIRTLVEHLRAASAVVGLSSPLVPPGSRSASPLHDGGLNDLARE